MLIMDKRKPYDSSQGFSRVFSQHWVLGFCVENFFPCATVIPRPTLLILEYVFGGEESIPVSISTFKESNKKKAQKSAFQDVHGFD